MTVNSPRIYAKRCWPTVREGRRRRPLTYNEGGGDGDQYGGTPVRYAALRGPACRPTCRRFPFFYPPPTHPPPPRLLAPGAQQLPNRLHHMACYCYADCPESTLDAWVGGKRKTSRSPCLPESRALRAAARGSRHAPRTCARAAAFASLRRRGAPSDSSAAGRSPPCLCFAARELAQLRNRTQMRLLVFSPRIGERLLARAKIYIAAGRGGAGAAQWGDAGAVRHEAIRLGNGGGGRGVAEGGAKWAETTCSMGTTKCK
ncbi:Protein of unknown function [Gryllus bimaculatus]|nr:Protein of unknown function [Gryllus bimaculatus]